MSWSLCLCAKGGEEPVYHHQWGIWLRENCLCKVHHEIFRCGWRSSTADQCGGESFGFQPNHGGKGPKYFPLFVCSLWLKVLISNLGSAAHLNQWQKILVKRQRITSAHHYFYQYATFRSVQLCKVQSIKNSTNIKTSIFWSSVHW